MIKIIKTCDIKNREHKGEVHSILIRVIFDHDQNDGKSKTAPYFNDVDIEICESCRKYMMENRKYIYDYEAMGYNEYSL